MGLGLHERAAAAALVAMATGYSGDPIVARTPAEAWAVHAQGLVGAHVPAEGLSG